MKVAVFNTKPYDREFLGQANIEHQHELHYFEPHLDESTVTLAHGFQAVCAFVNDTLDSDVLKALKSQGVTVVALRCAGFNNVDLKTAEELGMTVVRVPAYSPHAVAEHAVALMMALNRKINRAYNRVREGNFKLEGLLGFDFYGKTVGVVGMGKIGVEVARIMKGFGCKVLAHDPFPDPSYECDGIHCVDLPTLYAESDIITLHCPLTPETRHLISHEAIGAMKPGVMIINTSRGAIVDTKAAIHGLKTGAIGYLGLDVYEGESELFFEDLSDRSVADDVFARLLTFPNVIITGHQAFFTREAMQNIAATTLGNLTALETGETCPNRVPANA